MSEPEASAPDAKPASPPPGAPVPAPAAAPIETRPMNWRGPLALGIAVAILVAMYVSSHTEPSAAVSANMPVLRPPHAPSIAGNRLRLNPTQLQSIRNLHPRPPGPAMNAAPPAEPSPTPPAAPPAP